MKPPKSKDYDVRAAVVSQLLGRGVSRSDIRHEITLDTASSGGRADIVVLRDHLITIEIKSGSDKLDRLRDQISRYERSFDCVKIVADKRHAEAIHAAHNIYGAVYWCSETAQFMSGWHPRLSPCTPRLAEPAYRYSEETSLVDVARLLWRSEAARASKSLGGPNGTRMAAISWMREHAKLSELRPLVIKELRARVPNRWEDAFWGRFDAEQLQLARAG